MSPVLASSGVNVNVLVVVWSPLASAVPGVLVPGSGELLGVRPPVLNVIVDGPLVPTTIAVIVNGEPPTTSSVSPFCLVTVFPFISTY